MPVAVSFSDLVVDTASIPTKTNTFFGNWTHPKPLPTPAQVRASNLESGVLVLGQKVELTILCFTDLRLVVKFGRRASISEGQALWTLARYCPQVPVPEVYGWCQDKEETFLYMEYLDGRTLRTCLDTFTNEELQDIAAQIKSMMECMRCLLQPPKDMFIGGPKFIFRC
jgi:hypothetical protein